MISTREKIIAGLVVLLLIVVFAALWILIFIPNLAVSTESVLGIVVVAGLGGALLTAIVMGLIEEKEQEK